MRKNIITVLIAAMASVFILNSCKDKDDTEENPQNQLPVITSITADEQNITWNGTCQICVKAIDPEGSALSYSWSSAGGKFITPTTYSCVTWKAPASSESFKCTVIITDSINSVSAKITIYVGDPPFRFQDNFSEGANNWTFEGCNYSVENGKLCLLSTDSTAQARAKSYNFYPYPEIPWSLSGEVAITSAMSEITHSGISVHLKDTDPYALEHMWLLIRKNDEDVNWGWFFWMPSLANYWAPWDEKCYGISSYINTNTQTNHLEMSASSKKLFTLTANGHVLSADNRAIQELQGLAGIGVNLDIGYIKLRGGNQTTTQWDNILLYSTSPQKSESQPINAPMPPSAEDIEEVFRNIEQGTVVTLKSLLLERLGEESVNIN